MNILITGATGFIGQLLCKQLLADGHTVRGTLLSSESQDALVHGVASTVIEPLGPGTPWQEALSGIDTVIHLAARVHVMDDRVTDPLALFSLVNTLGTERLARESAHAGVQRVVFVSSIKVNGEESPAPYHAASPFNPQDPYAISKMEAELALPRVAAETGLEVVIVRPPLVYGPGVKANFLRMLQMIQRGIPLPLASIQNRRSLIYVGNLAAALATCATHPKAAGQTYLVSDGEDVSTPQLIRRCATVLGVTSRLFPCPVNLLRLAGRMTGKCAAVERLCGSLMIDASAIRQQLRWHPPYTLEQGLQETADWLKDKTP